MVSYMTWMQPQKQPQKQPGRPRRRLAHQGSAGANGTARPGPLKPLADMIRRISLSTLLLGTSAALAGPQGEQVIAGQGQINRPDVNTTHINQQSANLALDWTSFNIAQHELVQFNQPARYSAPCAPMARSCS